MRLATLFSALILSTSALAYCNDNGGEVPDCVKRAKALPYGHRVAPGTYVSGGTFVLKNAGCISQNTSWEFHSAYYGTDPLHVKELASNEEQMTMLEDYPVLLKYLVAVGAFMKVLPTTVLNGKEISYLSGLPLCEELDANGFTFGKKRL